MSESKTAGFIGVGMMGHGLAKNVQQAGYVLKFLDHPGNRPVDDLLAKGAEPLSSPAEIGRACDFIFLVVTGSPEVEDAVFGQDGLLEGLAPGKTVIDCSTALPESTLKVAAAIQAKGARYADAPMTRTPKEAEEGRVNVMVGADDATYAVVEPLLKIIAENIYRGGGIGAGHQLKLLHNYVSMAQPAILAETFNAARRGGVDLGTLCEVLESGGGGSTSLKRLMPYLMDGELDQFRFSIANACKDLGYYAGMASALGVPSVIAAATHQVYVMARSQGKGPDPVPTMIDFIDSIAVKK
ncbi:NAD(P)-dependent oxidoreductase [Roseovarius pacificus]|uniref:NAD(P)-dependent oxidoreductase n=1 Tax=Roseovarius pacificus TaxID=337701 RepID=UPI002A18DF03|nr:NAD(P)-dependent oxidoreductase [Roseovarius pacificus]